MAYSLNEVRVLGNIGVQPDLRITNSGTYLMMFSVATSESYKDKEGEWQEQTEWHRIVVWGKQAERLQKFGLDKGNKVLVCGKLRTNSYEDREGVKRYFTQIMAERVLCLTPKPGKSDYSEVSSEDLVPLGDDDIPF